ncbi:sulfocyanin-like copper-binding protein [Alicyclobacillus mali (ex Roth et al. 2021)]|uniref:sulfocyanin-like copper-binding protein n=1 Tax=Alicyclobacillus mali (ex Roth et al. 2021) TaxID=1123961 RepID=UPI000AD8CF2E|nr:sulfocyanin-like copper-binding protein [Alicyclobacillus mali (ex Roth et al. 2021)]
MRTRTVLAVAAVAMACAGCGATPQPSKPQAPLITWNAAHRLVEWTVVAGDGGENGGMNFDGYANGEMTLVVPVGWRVEIHFQNASFTPHSAMVVPESVRNRSSFDASLMAFPGAETPNPSEGSSKGAAANVAFTVSRAGDYALVCAVPGHALAGMWDKLVVSSQAKQPSLLVNRSP